MKYDQDFEIISSEIKRQYNLQMKIDSSHDTKIGIILGFTVLVLAQIILDKELVNLLILNKVSLYTFIAGVTLIIYSGYSGIRAYFIRKYKVGAELSELIDQYKNNEIRDYNKVISRKIYDSINENEVLSENKAIHIKTMFITFFIGCIIILCSKLIKMVV